jgi:hypothetical protein
MQKPQKQASTKQIVDETSFNFFPFFPFFFPLDLSSSRFPRFLFFFPLSLSLFSFYHHAVEEGEDATKFSMTKRKITKSQRKRKRGREFPPLLV